jgi:hypothetical protein
MPASYPAGVKGFTTKVDFTDLVLADHVNALQDEVRALQATIGTDPQVSGGWVGTLDKTTTSWATLKARIANLEYGVVNDSHTQYTHNTGGDTIQANGAAIIPLKLKGFSSQTADLLRFENAAGTTLTKIDKDGKLFINSQEIKPVLHQQTQPDGVALGLPQGTIWVDSDSNPSVLSVDTTIQITGGTLTGDQALTSRLRNITVSTSDPTGGNNGDIWLKYTV